MVAAVALAIAAASLLIPSTPSYDPWAWLVWGREIIHLNLQTTGGPTWKPLPVIFTTVFALFGRAQPDLWLVIARAGAVMAVVMTFAIAWRVTSQVVNIVGQTRARTAARSRWWQALPALLAGVLAAGSLINSRGFISDNALGYSEGLMTALVLIALERHLAGARRQALAVGFAAALDRPELWALWVPYGIYLAYVDRGARKLIAALVVLIPVLWFAPEYWGSGHLFRGVTRAHNPRSNSAAFASCPFCQEFGQHAWPTLLNRIKFAALLAAAAAAIALWRLRASWWRRGGSAPARVRGLTVLLGCAVVGFGWWVGIALETQAGFSGNDRYLVLGVALVAIAGAAGWGWGAGAIARGLMALSSRGKATTNGRSDTATGGAGDTTASPGTDRGRRVTTSLAATSAGVLAAVALFLAVPPWIGHNIIGVPRTHRALVYQAHLREDLASAVARVGGPGRILGCGTVMTEGFQVPMVAWVLGVHTLTIVASPTPGQPVPAPPNVIFQTRSQSNTALLPSLRTWPGVHYRLVTHVRTFRVYARCASKVAL